MAQAPLSSDFEVIPNPTLSYYDTIPTEYFAPGYCGCRNECKALYGINSICSECDRPHRFDEDRDNDTSTFSCTWCGDMIVNMEYDIRKHLNECDHSPRPLIFTEDVMCSCTQYCYCGHTPRFMNNYTHRFTETRQETRFYDGRPVWVDVRNVTRRHRPEMFDWNLDRIGYPPNHQALIADANERADNRIDPLNQPGR